MAARRAGLTLDRFVEMAVVEKLLAVRTVEFFRERARRADVSDALALLDQFGNDDPPREGDEIPEELLSAT